MAQKMSLAVIVWTQQHLIVKKLNFNAPQSVLYQNIFEQFQIWKSYIFILKQT